jgi:hypothetical protein
MATRSTTDVKVALIVAAVLVCLLLAALGEGFEPLSW